MITNAADRYCVDTGSVAIAVTVVICQASITSRPHIDVTFTATALQKKTIFPKEASSLDKINKILRAR